MLVNDPRTAIRHILYSMKKVRHFFVLFNNGKHYAVQNVKWRRAWDRPVAFARYRGRTPGRCQNDIHAMNSYLPWPR
jgi:hypothetical protein